MPRKPAKNTKRKWPSKKKDQELATALQIIGGSFRGRHLAHLQRAGTRPMKHRVREAIFNLVGIECKGKHAIDVFAGTGALGLEALSRGAASATFIELHVPTGRVVQQNIEQLEVTDRVELIITSAFLWCKRDLPEFAQGRPSKAAKVYPDRESPIWLGADKPWVIFCSPPFDFYLEKTEEMQMLIEQMLIAAPPGSTCVIEADTQFDMETLPNPWAGQVSPDGKPVEWDVRTYRPAVIGVLRKPSA